MRVLILGGNGFIGSAVARRLAGLGHEVTGLGRDVGAAARRLAGVGWLRADIAELAEPEAWGRFLAGQDAVVNCAGALQDGLRDDVAAVQDVAMRALYRAAAGLPVRLVVQISARTDGDAAGNPFFASKRSADAALKASGIDHVILRPAIVVDRNAYGGTALLRALAAMPAVTPLVHGNAPMQFVALDDVADCVADALAGRIAAGSDLDLAAPETLSLADAVAIHRQWLGLPPAPAVAVPGWLARLVAAGADLLGRLGWRSPMRSTALAVAAGGVTGHQNVPARPLGTLGQTLAAAPAGAQDLWFARLYLLKPLIFGMLALFWIASGVVALASFEGSANLLEAAGAPSGLAAMLAAVTSIADIVLGVAVLFRRHAARALAGMIMLSGLYLVAATLFAPALWLDPLGPLVKVVPSVVLALAALAILDER